MLKSRNFLVLLGALILLCLPSCLEVEQLITLKKDGSGTISEEIVMGAPIVAMLEGLPAGAGAENPFADLYDPEKYKAKASDFGKGVAYSRLETIERDGGKGVKAIYTFEELISIEDQTEIILRNATPGLLDSIRNLTSREEGVQLIRTGNPRTTLERLFLRETMEQDQQEPEELRREPAEGTETKEGERS